jgi:prephenate dehydrogenase
MEISIIGFGQLGQFIAKHLKAHLDVFVSDTSSKEEEAKEIGVKFVSLDLAASKDIVIIAVPINQFKGVIDDIKDKIKPGALLLDVCSVKVRPSEIMKNLISSDVEIIATHPLFGPQSGSHGINGLKIVLCPIRTKRLGQVKHFLEKLGLKVLIATPEEHDNQMAKTGCLAHFVGRALINLDIKEFEITEPSFNKLMELKDMLKEDSIELFNDIQKNNPFAAKIRKNIINELINIKI